MHGERERERREIIHLSRVKSLIFYLYNLTSPHSYCWIALGILMGGEGGSLP